MRPACWNREAFTDPNAGWKVLGVAREIVERNGREIVSIRPVYRMRYRWPWFTDRCTVHDKADIGPGLTYAQHYGWDCSGCKWKPEGVA